MYTPHFFSKIQMLLGPNLAHLLSAQDQGGLQSLLVVEKKRRRQQRKPRGTKTGRRRAGRARRTRRARRTGGTRTANLRL